MAVDAVTARPGAGLDAHELIGIEGARPTGPPIEKVYAFYATTVGGLESLALDDMKRRLKGMSDVRVHRRRRQGRIHFRYERSPQRLLELQAVEHVFAHLTESHQVTAGTPGLLRIAETVASADITPAVALHDVLHGPKKAVGFRVTCTVGRGHRFSASELQQVLQTVLADKYGLSPEELNGPYNLHVQIEGRRALAGFRLTAGSLSDRPYVVEAHPGDVPGIVGYAMVCAARMRRGQVWMDPWCGGGVAAVEGRRLRPDVHVAAGDPDGEALARASVNAEGEGLSLFWWDGRSLPARDGGVDGVVTSLHRRALPGGVAPALADIERVLRPGGTAVVLMDRDREVEESIAGESAFQIVNRRPVHFHGHHPAIYVLQKSED